MSFEDGGPGSAALDDEPPIDDERDAEPEQQPPLALPAPAESSDPLPADLEAPAPSPASDPSAAQQAPRSPAEVFAQLGRNASAEGEYLPRQVRSNDFDLVEERTTRSLAVFLGVLGK